MNYEELRKSVVHYLAKKDLVFDDVELKITDLPEPKRLGS
jgi:hypothetical protein